MTVLPNLERLEERILEELLRSRRRSGPRPRLLSATTVKILKALRTHGVPMRRKELDLAAGLDPRHSTTDDALRLLTTAGVVGVVGRPDRSRRYVLLADQLAEMLAALDPEPEPETEVVVKIKPPDLVAPTCRCDGQVMRDTDDGALRCIKCGRDPAVAA